MRLPAAVALRGEVGLDLRVDLGPARVQLDAQCPARAARDGRAEQRPTDPRERIEHQLTAPLKNSISRAISRRGLFAPCAFRRACPSLYG